MTTKLYLSSDLFSKVLPHATGCPPTMIAAAWRKAMITLCETSLVWREWVTAIPTVDGTSSYTPAAPTGTEIVTIVQAEVDDIPAEVRAYEYLIHRYPTHPNAAAEAKSIPRVVAQPDARTIEVYPVPDAVYTLSLYVALKPTVESTGADEALMQQYQTTLVHGALFELLAIPERPWTNIKLADYYGRRFRNDTTAARARLNKGHTRGSLGVAMARVI